MAARRLWVVMLKPREFQLLRSQRRAPVPHYCHCSLPPKGCLHLLTASHKDCSKKRNFARLHSSSFSHKNSIWLSTFTAWCKQCIASSNASTLCIATKGISKVFLCYDYAFKLFKRVLLIYICSLGNFWMLSAWKNLHITGSSMNNLWLILKVTK